MRNRKVRIGQQVAETMTKNGNMMLQGKKSNSKTVGLCPTTLGIVSNPRSIVMVFQPKTAKKRSYPGHVYQFFVAGYNFESLWKQSTNAHLLFAVDPRVAHDTVYDFGKTTICHKSIVFLEIGWYHVMEWELGTASCW